MYWFKFIKLFKISSRHIYDFNDNTEMADACKMKVRTWFDLWHMVPITGKRKGEYGSTCGT